MTLTITTPASSVKLTSLEIVKAELDIADSSEDIEIARFIDQASKFIPNYTNRVFAREVITEKIGSVGEQILMLERTPIVSVSQIRHSGTTIGSTTFDIDDADAGLLFREVGWTDTVIYTSFITPIRTRFAKKNWEIDYTAGYILHGSTEGDPNIPEDLTRAATDLVKSWYLKRDEDPGVKSERTGDASETRYDVTKSHGLPPSIANMLAPYVRLD